MHTDEYEISLRRELNACEKQLTRIRKRLSYFEKKYEMRTEVFVVEYGGGSLNGQKADLSAWIREYEALKKWETLRDQYAELLRKMKI
jgi:hypothetical protein